MTGLNYEINLDPELTIDLMKHLIEPLAANQTPINPITNKPFNRVTRHSRAITQFCTQLRTNIEALENSIPNTNHSDFTLNTEFELIQNLSFEEIIDYFNTHKTIDPLLLTENDLLTLKTHCRKTQEILLIIEDSLINYKIKSPINSKVFTNDYILYSITSLSSSQRLPYYVTKASMKIGEYFGMWKHKSIDIPIIREEFNREKCNNYLKLIHDSLKDDEQFSILNHLFKKNIKNTPELQQLFTLFDTVKHGCSILVENNYFSEGILIGKYIYKRIEKILENDKNSKIINNRNNQIIKYLKEIQLFVLKEIAYSSLRENDLWSAVYYGKIAKELGSEFYQGWYATFGLFYDAVDALYKLNNNNFSGAEKLLNNIEQFTKKATVYFHVDIISFVFGELATKFVFSHNYIKAKQFYEAQLKYVLIMEKMPKGKLLFSPTSSATLKNRIKNLENKLEETHKNTILSLLNESQYSSLIMQPGIDGEFIHFQFKNLDLIEQLKNIGVTVELNENENKIASLNPKKIKIKDLRQALSIPLTEYKKEQKKNTNTEENLKSSYEKIIVQTKEKSETTSSFIVKNTSENSNNNNNKKNVCLNETKNETKKETLAGKKSIHPSRTLVCLS